MKTMFKVSHQLMIALLVVGLLALYGIIAGLVGLSIVILSLSLGAYLQEELSSNERA